MKELEIRLNPNPLVQFLKKPASEFTRQDIIYYIEENEIEMINFRYMGEDGKLKSLNFVINSKQHLEDLLSTGERVDGSSLFSYIEAGSSDLYVIPRFKTAFVNPFSRSFINLRITLYFPTSLLLFSSKILSKQSVILTMQFISYIPKSSHS